MTPKVVIFGAGATGRAHVGLLAYQAGLDLVFVEQRSDLVNVLRRSGRYSVKVYDGRHCEEVEVSGYRVYHSKERTAVAQEIIDAGLVLTAVFDPNLPDVAETLALAVHACRKAGRREPLNCLACENMMDSSTKLGDLVRSLLDNDDRIYSEAYVAFPDCMISRVVPQPESTPLILVTEDYNEWTARAEVFKGRKPSDLTALELVDNQTARLERKLMIHNGGHAACGYFGFHRGHQYIHHALADPEVVERVTTAMDEIGEVVRRKHGFSIASIDDYKADLARRGRIAEMRDQILRVVRDPIRKLSARERLVAPALSAIDYELPHRSIVKAIVAALKYRHPEDSQSLELARRLEEDGLISVLEQVCSIREDSPLADEISKEWADWRW